MKKIEPFKDPIYITRPLLPSLNNVYEKIKEIWKSKWLTNMGFQHHSLELELKKYLKVKNLTLFCNGTLALEIAIKALELSGEIITTPFTFPATTNAIIRNYIKPIFCDINVDDFNIDPSKITALINPNTSAILPVHVFGIPCKVAEIEKIARENDLKVIYDAAHCFGVEYKNIAIGNFGDISMFSFHATKIFHTIEGGALTYKDPELIEKLNLLKNFGIKSEEEIILPGTNAKMNEFQAAIGLLNLELIDMEIKKRKELFKTYLENLKDIEGIKCMNENKDIKNNYQYFPILINKDKFNYSRDQVYEKLKKFNIFTRKYFHPLCTEYKYFKSEKIINIPNAIKITNEILCLPLYGNLNEDDIIKICDILKKIKNL